MHRQRESKLLIKFVPPTCQVADTIQECNIILSQSFEYRQPSSMTLKAAAEATPTSAESVKVDMTSRYLGLIVVPGQYITKIESEGL